VDLVAYRSTAATWLTRPHGAAVDESTILLVGSAPSYPQGVVDPIEDLAAVALRHDLLFHVDACMGGFMLPFWRAPGASSACSTSGSRA